MANFTRATKFFRAAVLMRQRLYHYCEANRNVYGVAGNVLSGGAYPHWPDDVRRRVRLLNRAMNRLDDAGFDARPKYVRMDTMRTLRGQVTMDTIRAQHTL